jgi:hypothetical protein
MQLGKVVPRPPNSAESTRFLERCCKKRQQSSVVLPKRLIDIYRNPYRPVESAPRALDVYAALSSFLGQRETPVWLAVPLCSQGHS